MNKKEIIWRKILYQASEEGKYNFIQQELAQEHGFSVSTVFQALQVPRRSGIVDVGGRGFSLIDFEKLLYLWSTVRNIEKEIIYTTHISKNVTEIEGELPPSAIFGFFSAFRKKFDTVPTDYDRVYAYINEKNLDDIKQRFPASRGYENLFILAPDPWLEKFGNITPSVQMFADLWNTPEWYAKDFVNALRDRFNL